MRINPKVIYGIVKKDFHSLLPLILLGCVVFAAQPIVANLKLDQAGELLLFLRVSFYWLGYFIGAFLLISVLQLDPALSINHDWLTRPINRVDLFSAKVLFLLLSIYLPIVMGHFLVNLANLGLTGSVNDAMAIKFSTDLMALPLIFAIALLTPTIKKTISVLVILFLLFVFLPGWDGSAVIFEPLGIDIRGNFGGMNWLLSIPLLMVGFSSVFLVYWLLYCRHQQRSAWLAFSICMVLMFLCKYPPSAVFDRDDAIAVLGYILNDAEGSLDIAEGSLDIAEGSVDIAEGSVDIAEGSVDIAEGSLDIAEGSLDIADGSLDIADGSLDDAVGLEKAYACYQATPMSGDAENSGADGILRQANWNEPILKSAEPGSLTLATTVTSRTIKREWITLSNRNRDIAFDWRLDKIQVRGSLKSDSLPEDLELLRARDAFSNFVGVNAARTDYWLIPGSVVNAVADDPSTRLILDYDLVLLSPTIHELKTDGQRYDLAELGSCRAELKSNASSIEIDCIKQGAQPALVSAELPGVHSSRVDNHFQADYAPEWFESLGRKRYELSLAYPNLVDSSIILLSAWHPERVMHKRLETPGLLGATASLCPLPNLDDPIEKSSWSDKSPHEISQITVERGVRIEVLDWRNEQQVDKPVLFMLPGLGATAHSYDDIAPKLTQKYQVVAMTRRGVGGSGKPDHGYDIARLSQDVIQVLDTLGIESPILVGHSYASEELSYLGAKHSELFSGLIYLDAAYDRSESERFDLKVLLPVKPAPYPSELVSYEALKQYSLRTGGSGRTIPEGEIMASYDPETGGNRIDRLYLDATMMGVEKPDYARITLPALAIYAVTTSPEAAMEYWYDRNDPQIQQAVKQGFEASEKKAAELRQQFREGVANSEVLELENASHWVFISNEEDVLSAIDGFVDRLEL